MNKLPIPSPCKSIKLKCLQCKEDKVSQCIDKLCPLWYYRLGTRPHKAKNLDLFFDIDTN